MTGEVRTTTATVRRAVYRTDGDALVNLCLSQPAAWTTTTKRREENSFHVGLDQRVTLCPVSAWVSDRLWAGKPPRRRTRHLAYSA